MALEERSLTSILAQGTATQSLCLLKVQEENIQTLAKKLLRHLTVTLSIDLL